MSAQPIDNHDPGAPDDGEPYDPTVVAMPERRFEPTEMGTMRRLVDQYGHALMFVAGTGRWHHWDGTRWAADRTGEVHRYVKMVVDGLLDEIRGESNDARRKLLVKHYAQAQTSRVQRGVLALAETEIDLVVTVDQLDVDPWALNVQNGTIDLRTGTLRPHQREDRITKIAPVTHDANATCPRWEAFVTWACRDDLELIAYLQRLVGYSLTGDVSEQVLLFCHGDGANGKSTFLGVLQRMLGLDADGYALQGAPRLLVAERHAEHPTAIADLVGRRLVVCQEITSGARLDEVRVKDLTGGDPIKARHMRQDFFTFEPTGTIFLAANHKPRVRGTDHAIWRRVKLIPFNATVSDNKRDPHLADKLRAELPGILAWAVRGCLDWQAHGLGDPASVRAATDNYRAGEDVVARFLDDACQLDQDHNVGATELYQAYTTWCSTNGEHPVSQKALADHFAALGLDHKKHPTTRRWTWGGIGLTTSDQGELEMRNHTKPTAV